MLKSGAISAFGSSRFHQWQTMRCLSKLSETGHSVLEELTAAPASAGSPNATNPRLDSLGDILARANIQVGMASSPDTEERSVQPLQNPPRPLSLLTRSSSRTIPGSFVARAQQGDQRKQRAQEVKPVADDAADDGRRASAVSLISRNTMQTSGLRADEQKKKAGSWRDTFKDLLEQARDTKTEESAAEEDAMEELDEWTSRDLADLIPQTQLAELFAAPCVGTLTQLQAALRSELRRELAGDYSNYLPSKSINLGWMPLDCAQFALGRNKQIPLHLQTAALDVIKRSIQGEVTKTGKRLHSCNQPVFIPIHRIV
ncbi:hypothetical protein BU15DRAFT_70896 [Melanogaster broomeanus]|nr:hypothetical protein BU15DRAFT_70896 [Melanogaster broomeanus]